MPDTSRRSTVPILALDVPTPDRAFALLDSLPGVEWVKVGLQLFIAGGGDVVRGLRKRGYRVFLDLKLHDIPNTVGRAVEAAAALDVDLLTVHVSGGSAMLRAAQAAAGGPGRGGPRLLGVTLLTSLSAREVGEAWGREDVSAEMEVRRLAGLAHEAGLAGVVASVHEVRQIREQAGDELLLLTPGIRLAGDSAGDQSRVATPEDASRLGIDFIVIGRTVTAATDPVGAWARVEEGILRGAQGVQPPP
jgi:orotidine-5'-phosphate decarboxylase